MIVVQVNTHKEVRFLMSLWRHTLRYFMQKSAAIWWVHTQHLPGAYAAVPDPSYIRVCC